MRKTHRILSFTLILLIGMYPTNTATLKDNILISLNTVVVLEEHFTSDSIWTDGNWSRTGTFIYVDEINGYLHKDSWGSNTDEVSYAGNFTLPVSIETRFKIVSGGQGYVLPHVFFTMSNLTIYSAKLGNTDHLFMDEGWTPPGYAPINENVWWHVKINLTSSEQVLYSKSDSDTNWTEITKLENELNSTIINVGYHGPWDPVYDIDYLIISSISQVVTTSSTATTTDTSTTSSTATTTDTSTTSDTPTTSSTATTTDTTTTVSSAQLTQQTTPAQTVVLIINTEEDEFLGVPKSVLEITGILLGGTLSIFGIFSYIKKNSKK